MYSVHIHYSHIVDACVNCCGAVPVDTSGSSIGVGLKFLGGIISSILFVLIVLIVWKLIEILVERFRRTGSADGPPSDGHPDLRRRNPDEEVNAGCMTQLLEKVKSIAGRSRRRPLLHLLLLRPEAVFSTEDSACVAAV